MNGWLTFEIVISETEVLYQKAYFMRKEKVNQGILFEKIVTLRNTR